MELQVRVDPAEGEDAGEESSWAALLHEELSDLDEVQLTVTEAPAEGGPPGSKGIALGALLAKVAPAAVGKLLDALRAWAARTGRSVEASIDGDAIKITGASREQQQRVIEAWLARHPAGS